MVKSVEKDVAWKYNLPNKSKSYLLPLLSDFVDIKYINLMINSFIFYEEDKEEEESPKLLLLYKYDDKVNIDSEGNKSGFLYYIDYLKEHKLYNYDKDLLDCILFNISIPDYYYYEYYCFLSGRYSYYRDESKDKILRFLRHNYSNLTVINKIKQVLYKDKRLKLSLEELLNIKIDENSELSSIVQLHQETFYEDEFIKERQSSFNS